MIDEDQNPTPPPPTQNVQARLGTTNEMMTGQYNPSPAQRRVVQEVPAELRTQGERLTRILGNRLPALQRSLQEAGIGVRPGPR